MTKHLGANAGGDYFVREDAEKKRRIAAEMARKLDEDQRAALRELHHMHCPRCGMPLQTVQHGSIEVDACFACGGAFLGKSAMEVIAAPKQKGIMGAILNLFEHETHHPVK